jgi:nucleotide-binding universal stress UspA family protein
VQEEECRVKNILVLLAGTETDPATLRTAFLAARLFGSRLDCLHVQPGLGQIVMSAAVGQFSSVVNNAALIRSIEKQADERKEAARAAFAAFRAEHGLEVHDALNGGHGITAKFRDLQGEPVSLAIAEARFHDLVVMSRGTVSGGLGGSDVGALLLAAGRPVLLAPNAAPDGLGATVAIAWKETAEAARAITAAQPFLAKADRIFVLTADEGDGNLSVAIETAGRIAGQLRNHGFSAEADCVVLGNRRAPDAIVTTARELGADLLVMGAYGHSRMRELLFGGFTRHIVEACPIPVLLFH